MHDIQDGPQPIGPAFLRQATLEPEAMIATTDRRAMCMHRTSRAGLILMDAGHTAQFLQFIHTKDRATR